MGEMVSERRKTFAVAYNSEEYFHAYLFACRHVSSVIAKVNAEVWRATRSSLSPTANSKSVYSLRLFVADLLFVSNCSSSFSSPNFPSCSALKK